MAGVVIIAIAATPASRLHRNALTIFISGSPSVNYGVDVAEAGDAGLILTWINIGLPPAAEGVIE
jgi:hypothetical protein